MNASSATRARMGRVSSRIGCATYGFSRAIVPRQDRLPLCGFRKGEVSPSYGEGGVKGHKLAAAYDPSARYAGTSSARAPRRGGKTTKEHCAECRRWPAARSGGHETARPPSSRRCQDRIAGASPPAPAPPPCPGDRRSVQPMIGSEGLLAALAVERAVLQGTHGEARLGLGQRPIEAIMAEPIACLEAVRPRLDSVTDSPQNPRTRRDAGVSMS